MLQAARITSSLRVDLLLWTLACELVDRPGGQWGEAGRRRGEDSGRPGLADGENVRSGSAKHGAIGQAPSQFVRVEKSSGDFPSGLPAFAGGSKDTGHQILAQAGLEGHQMREAGALAALMGRLSNFSQLHEVVLHRGLGPGSYRPGTVVPRALPAAIPHTSPASRPWLRGVPGDHVALAFTFLGYATRRSRIQRRHSGLPD